MPTRTVLPWKSSLWIEHLTRLKIPTSRDLIVRDSGRRSGVRLTSFRVLDGNDWLKFGLTTLAAAS